MKRFLVFIAVALVLAVAAPVFAGPFSDVPQDHWAYSALEKLQATGILTGYADGTFQGKNTLTRYEIAVIVSKILDQVAAERALLSEKVDALENGLTAGQAEDVIAIFKSLIAKDEEEQAAAQQPEQAQQPVTVVEKETVIQKETEVIFPETLTDAQAAEVAAIVEALTMEFKFELQALGAKVDALTTKVDGMDSRLAALEQKVNANHVFWSGYYSLNVNRTAIDGITSIAYLNPFVFDFDGDDDVDSYDKYANSNLVRHLLNLDMAVKTNNLSASFDLGFDIDNFIAESSADLTLKDLYGEVTAENFKAVAGVELDGTMTSYLMGNADALYNGIKVNVGNDMYVFYRDYQIETDENDEEVVDAEGNPVVAVNDVVFAGKTALPLNSTLYFGTNDLLKATNMVAGLNVPVNFLGFEFKNNVATQKVDEKFYKYVTVNGKKVAGPLTLEGNYTLKDAAFVGMANPYGIKLPGYDAKASLNLFADKVKANVRYLDYTKTSRKYDVLYGGGAEVAFGHCLLSFDYEQGTEDDVVNAVAVVQEIQRTKGQVKVTKDIAFLNVAAGYKYDQYVDENDNPATDAFEGHYGYWNSSDVWVALEEYNRATSDLTAKLFVPGLSATANYVYGIDNTDYKGKGLTTHKYGVKFEQGIVAANAGYDVVNKVTTAGISVDPKAINVLGFGIDTKAGVSVEKATATLYNYNLGIDVTKAINAKATAKAGYLYDSRDIADTGDQNGYLIKRTAGIDYALTADSKITVSYTNLDFVNSVSALKNYSVDQFKAGLSLNF